MKSLRLTTRYKKDLKRMADRGHKITKLVVIVDKLRKGEPLLPIDDDHPLKGPWDSYRSCHIQGDWCLIYKITDDELILARTGTHSDLYK